MSSNLDTIIAPEVFEDEFYAAIVNLARSAPIDSVLETGSSPGGGSTSAWVEGLRRNPRNPKLYCMEVSRMRWAALKERWDGEGFVESFHGSSVRADQFGSADEVRAFYEAVDGPMRRYPLPQVLEWLDEDLACLRQEDIPSGLIAKIKSEKGIRHFGAVLIDGSEFTGNGELDEVYGAEFILLDDTRTFKCHQARRRLLHDPGYEMIADNPDLRHGYSIFRRRRRTLLDPLPSGAPVHYFTIVLNGEPFIRYHINILRRLPFRWHWHIVEGAAELTHGTAWSKAAGGVLNARHHADGLSTDGTTAYLDQLRRDYPQQVSIYRPPAGRRWDGKIEMVAEPIRHIFEDGILWQIDADELWTAAQLIDGRQLFLRSPEKRAAWFWCHYFVGPELVVASRNGFSQNPSFEWIRAWNFRPGMKWLNHSPTALAERNHDGTWRDLARGPCFKHAETEALGLVFQHFACTTEEQLAFKEQYYGYTGARAAWCLLQQATDFPLPLKQFLPWITDDTLVDSAASRGVVPLAKPPAGEGSWVFSDAPTGGEHPPVPTIVVDGIFHQLNNTGIATVWREILKLWAESDFAARVHVLDRDGTAPRLPGIRYRRVPRLDPDRPGEDSLMLQAICDELNAGVFISTYYSGPTTTPSVVLIYDMIPELLGIQETNWQWARKNLDILRAGHLVCVSESTSRDLRRIYPALRPDQVSVIPLAAPPEFRPAGPVELDDFRRRHNLSNNYLLLSGERIGIHVNTQGYKNAGLAFKAWSLLTAQEQQHLSIVCAGGLPELEEELRLLAPAAEVRVIRFSEADLRLAYAGATVLIYPSLYEGFGLPIVEAMACGCPVITCRSASLPEVAGEAAIYVDPWDPSETVAAIRTLLRAPERRAQLIASGLEQASGLSYQTTAESLALALLRVADQPRQASHGGTVWEALALLQSEKAQTEDSRQALLERSKETVLSLRLVKEEKRKLKKKIADLKQKRSTRKRPLGQRVRDFLREMKISKP